MAEINGHDYKYYSDLIRGSEPSYINSNKNKRIHRELISKLRSKQIIQFYKSKANLDLEDIKKGQETTWEKAVMLASFVAQNVLHDNQKIDLNKRNAISLWKYSRKVPTGFNCRWHSIMLSELLLAAGIKNCFITCLPMDRNDGDCHVVNSVWLPETKSWAMIDSDMMEYATDKSGKPISLKDMREYISAEREFDLHALPGFENSWAGSDYMKCYWSKNLYWFARHTTYGFNLESGGIWNDRYICLVPNDYHFDRNKFGGVETNCDTEFWDLI